MLRMQGATKMIVLGKDVSGKVDIQTKARFERKEEPKVTLLIEKEKFPDVMRSAGKNYAEINPLLSRYGLEARNTININGGKFVLNETTLNSNGSVQKTRRVTFTMYPTVVYCKKYENILSGGETTQTVGVNAKTTGAVYQVEVEPFCEVLAWLTGKNLEITVEEESKSSGDVLVTLEQMKKVKIIDDNKQVVSWANANMRDVLTWDTTTYIPIYTEKRPINQNDIDALNDCLKTYNITGAQIAHFIAQCSHECGCGNAGIEKYGGTDPITYFAARDIWRENFDDIDLKATDSFYSDKEKIKQYAIVNNLQEKYKGYGAKYRGAGAMQMTHYCLYKPFGEYIPDNEILKQGAGHVAKKYFWNSAGWLWKHYYKMDKKFENGAIPSVEELTRVINGGTNGLSERKAFYEVCKELFK